MANPKILEKKQAVIDEITNNVKESSSFIFLENTGLTVAETMELRRMLKKSDSEFLQEECLRIWPCRSPLVSCHRRRVTPPD